MTAKIIIRRTFHTLFMLSILYLIGSKKDFKDSIYWFDRNITVLILGFAVGGSLGILLEWIQSYLKVGDFTKWGILTYAIGGALGAFLSSIYPDGLNIVCYSIMIVFVGWGVYDILNKK